MSSNEMTTTGAFGATIKPYNSAINAGAVSIETERAVSEARGQIQIAQMFPRDVVKSRAELMDECDCIEFAEVAAYAVPRAGGTVTGPSIRLAEAVASAYGHMEWGHRELSRSEGKSEVEVFAWDKQKNNRRIRQITVEHVIDTRQGPRPMRDSKEIDDKIANVASKQMRGAILALVPKSFTEAAIARCKLTLAGGGGVPIKQRVEKMTDAFAKTGVTVETLKKYLGHPLDQTNGDELVDLTAIYNAIKAGDKISDYFGGDDEIDESTADSLKNVKSMAEKGAAAAAAKASGAKAAEQKANADADAQAKVVEDKEASDRAANKAAAAKAASKAAAAAAAKKAAEAEAAQNQEQEEPEGGQDDEPPLDNGPDGGDQGEVF